MPPEPDTPTITGEGRKLPVRRDTIGLFELDQRRANAYAESGYWPDAKSQAQALVKIEAGRALGLPAIVAMSEVHVIQGKPTLGAGALAALVKTSGRYDYRIVEHTEERCTIRFLALDGDVLGESVFTLDDPDGEDVRRPQERRDHVRDPIPDEVKPSDEQRQEVVTLMRTLDDDREHEMRGRRCEVGREAEEHGRAAGRA
jgi:hypothetical protein